MHSFTNLGYLFWVRGLSSSMGVWLSEPSSPDTPPKGGNKEKRKRKWIENEKRMEIRQ